MLAAGARRGSASDRLRLGRELLEDALAATPRQVCLIPHTDKHIWLQPYNVENIEYLMKISAVAAGGEEAVLDNVAGAYLRALTTCPEISDAAMNRDELLKVATGGHFLQSPNLYLGPLSQPVSPRCLATPGARRLRGRRTQGRLGGSTRTRPGPDRCPPACEPARPERPGSNRRNRRRRRPSYHRRTPNHRRQARGDLMRANTLSSSCDKYPRG